VRHRCAGAGLGHESFAGDGRHPWAFASGGLGLASQALTIELDESARTKIGTWFKTNS